MAQSVHDGSENGGVLLVADHSPTTADRRRLERRHPRIKLLDLSPDEQVDTGSLLVERLRVDDLLDLDRMHREFLEALDRWPRETFVDGCRFDDLFRHTTGDSLWWVGPGSQRHPFGGPFLPVMRALFLVRAACHRHRPSLVVVTTQNRQFATVIGSYCSGARQSLESLSDSARPLSPPGSLSRSLWTIRTCVSLAVLPLWVVIRAWFARLVTKPSPAHDESSSLVLSGWYPNHVRQDETGRPYVWYWRRLSEAIEAGHPQVAVRYLFHTTSFRFDGWKRLLRPIYPGWGRLRKLNGVLPLTQTQLGIRAYLTGAVRQWQLMKLYRRFEASPEFNESFTFADADCSCLLVSPLRSAVASVAKWSRNVAATAATLTAAGRIRAVLVHEEFYPKGMLTIAAARSLRIPTVGVQHGAVGPQHTVYMPPPGQFEGAPIPDWFAAYGEATARILCEQGAYPRERVLIAGAPRLDELASGCPDGSIARQELGWPPEDPVILLTTETFALSGPIYRELIDIAQRNPHWNVVVKLHPHDRRPVAYQQVLSSAAVSNVELCRDRLRERVAGCDVLVTGYSTTAMEGLLMGKRVVCADFTTAPPRYPFIDSGVALSARFPEALYSAIECALQSPLDETRRRQFLEDHLGPTLDASAGEVFASQLGDLFLTETAPASL